MEAVRGDPHPRECIRACCYQQNAASYERFREREEAGQGREQGFLGCHPGATGIEDKEGSQMHVNYYSRRDLSCLPSDPNLKSVISFGSQMRL